MRAKFERCSAKETFSNSGLNGKRKHVIFLALNKNFNSLSFDPLGSSTPLHGAVKFGYSLALKKCGISLLSANLGL